MRVLIRDNFFKSVPQEKKEIVLNNLEYFYREIKKNYNNIKNIPKGFWIKKLMGLKNCFEFRVNNGDRVFFSLGKRGSEDEKFTFLLYSSHDHGVRNARQITSVSTVDFKIREDDFIPTEKKDIDESLYSDYNNVITYEVKDDNFFRLNEDNKYFYYYLNDEQNETIKANPPIFVMGSAGSGKSTITLRKILNLEENNEVYNFTKIGYFTGNSYLKDNIEDQYEYFRDETKERIAKFYTLKEYYKKTLKIDTRRIVNFKKFKEFLRFSFPNRRKLKLEDENIYFEITGIIEGFMGRNGADNWKKDESSLALTLEEYCNLSKKYSILDKELKEEIYKIYTKYIEWKKKENRYDSNDLASNSINEDDKFDFILVDEVQDLTETEINFLANLVKNKRNIIFAGDIHQMVNFNSFSFERLKNLYHGYQIEYKPFFLQKNYRSSKEIVKLSNHLTVLRKKYIGNLGLDDYKEGAILSEGRIKFLDIDYGFAEKFQNDTHSAIIVANEDEKLRLKEISDIKYRIFTVNEIKGLEYKNILCYNLISNNSWAWEKIFSGKAKQDQRYRKYFNLFYVGITRAQKNLIIMEENNDNKLLQEIKTYMDIKKSDEIDLEKEKIIEDITFSTKDEWFAEGKRLYGNEDFEQAQEAFEKAGYPTWILEREIELDIDNGDYELALEKVEANKEIIKQQNQFKKRIIDDLYSREDYLKALKYLEKFDNLPYKYNEIRKMIIEKLNEGVYSRKEINKLIPMLMNKKEFSIIGDAYFILKQYEQALSFYTKSSNLDGIKKSRYEMLKEKFKNIPNREKQINKLLELIGTKSVNTADRNGLTPLGKAVLEEDSIDIANMLISLGASTKENIKLKDGMGSYLHLSQYSKSPLKWLKFFYDENIDINITNSKKETPLFYAVSYNNKKSIQFLLENGCNVNHENNKKENILFNMIRDKDIKNFKFFIKKVEDLNKKNKKDESIEDILNNLLEGKGLIGMKKEEDLDLRKLKLIEEIYKNEIKRRENLKK